MEKNIFNEDHLNRLPTVRISKITIKNIKDVKNGVLEFACSKTFVPEGTHCDILGIYGQNGSGKTTLIQVLKLIKGLISGYKLSPSVAELISYNCESSFVEIKFEFQYPNSDVRDVIYSFNMCKQNSDDDNFDEETKENALVSKTGQRFKPLIYDEKLSFSGTINGKKYKQQIFLEVNNDENIGPNSKLSNYFSATTLSRDKFYKISSNIYVARKAAKSSLFSKEFFSLIDNNSNPFVEMIKELKLFAEDFLYVFNSSDNVFVRGNFALPIYTEIGPFFIHVDRPNVVQKEIFEIINNEIFKISSVLSKLIPGLELTLINIVNTKVDDGGDGVSFELASKRGERILPIRYEADGVRKIIMYIKLIIAAFNQKSTTVAIDELDAGVFEFLIGEILEIFEKHGKGQLIFTSHNLRPLEILDKKFLCFTTSNPENRYIRLKGVGHSNNLRLLYLKEVALGGTQDETLYNKEKQFSILGALKKCKVFEEY